MISQRSANLIFALLLLILTAWMAWIASHFQTPALGDATLPTKFFPLILLGFIALCVVIYAREYIYFGHSGGDGDEQLYKDSTQAKAGLLTLASACLSYVIWQEFGFMAAGVFATLAISFSMGARQVSHFAIIIIGAVLTYAVFTYGLGTQFR